MEKIKAIEKILVIMNPVSGQQDFKSLHSKVINRLDQQSIKYEIKITKEPDDAFNWSHTAKPCTLVIASGGDGTIMECLNGIIKSENDNLLAQIPVGTANILARSLNIPTKPLIALEVALEQVTIKTDVGYVENHDKYFALMAGAGFDAELINDANRELKNKFGFFAYIISGVKNLFKLSRSRVTLEVDGVSKRYKAHTVMIINIGKVSKLGLSLGHSISPHDGTLNMMVVKPEKFGGITRLLAALLRQKLSVDRGVDLVSCTKVTVQSRPTMPLQIDGEVIGNTPFSVIIKPAAIDLVVPKMYKESISKN